MKNKVNVLQVVVGGKTFAGIASYLYQQYKAINKEEVHFDFLFTKENSMQLVENDPIFEDSKFFFLNAKSKKSSSNDYVKIVKGLRKILNEYEYDVVVVNSSVIEVCLACFIATRGKKGTAFIAHAHNSALYIKQRTIRKRIAPIIELFENICRKIVREGADYLFGCSEDAGRFTFGKESVLKDNFLVVKNAIDLAAFNRNKSERSIKRILVGADDKTLVCGSVGSLKPIKNLEFLIEVFDEIHTKNENSQLWIVGDGPEKDKLESKVKSFNLENYVIFWGQRSDVANIMQGMDAFVFTSLSEGLGIVAIEAQAALLPTIVSSGVPDDVLITELARKVSLNVSAKDWANIVLDQAKVMRSACEIRKQLECSGYDIKLEANKITRFYIDHFG